LFVLPNDYQKPGSRITMPNTHAATTRNSSSSSNKPTQAEKEKEKSTKHASGYLYTARQGKIIQEISPSPKVFQVPDVPGAPSS
jgi:hypothetical protein